MKKEKKQPNYAAKFFRRLTASLILLLVCALLKSYFPGVYKTVHSNLTYTPDLTEIKRSFCEFVLKYTP